MQKRATVRFQSFLLLPAIIASCLLCLETGAVRAEEPVSEQPIVLSESAKRAIGLETIVVSHRPVRVSISTVGKVEAIPTREFVQHAPLSGRVTEVHVKLGDHVKAGQILAILNSPEINVLAAETLQTKSQIEAEIKRTEAELASEINQAEAEVELAEANYNRDKTLVEEEIGSKKALQTSLAQFKVAQSRLQMAKKKKQAVMEGLTTKLKVASDSFMRRLQQLGASKAHIEKMLQEQRTLVDVPVVGARDGTVSRIDASPGQSIDPAVPLFVVSDLRKVWATANIYESDMSAVHIGQLVEILVAAYPNKRFKGVLTFISPVVDAQTRTLPVRVEIDNVDLSLKPGMFATLNVFTAATRPAILIPRNAVIQNGDRYTAFVSTDKGYRPQYVETGRNFGKDIEIIAGINPGDEIVVKGAFQLDSERLKLHGQTELFTHPSEEAEEEHEGNERANHTTQTQTLVLVAIAFLLGVAVTILAVALTRRKTSRNMTSVEKDQISTHVE
jgi:cobalt-zinc-cadmium efflux system membrane fusion protein